MSGTITLVSHSSTSATVAAAFAADEPLDARGAGWAEEGRGRLPRAARAVCSPATACLQTAEALGLVDVAVDPAVADWDLGRWRGRTLDEVAAQEPDAVTAWLSEPGEAPHGGESHAAFLERIAAWLADVPGDGATTVVTHAAVVRAVVVAVLQAPPAGFWRLDVAPLTVTRLRGGPGRWTVRSTAVPLLPT